MRAITTLLMCVAYLHGTAAALGVKEKAYERVPLGAAELSLDPRTCYLVEFQGWVIVIMQSVQCSAVDRVPLPRPKPKQKK